MERRIKTSTKVVVVPLLVSVILISVGLLSGDTAVLGNLITISVFIIFVPYSLYRYASFMRVRSIENQFPNFVRDLADSTRSGMSLPEAIEIASRVNYGKLSSEVQKMKNRLSWGTSFFRVLEIFGESVKDSKIVQEAIHIIRQSYESGGSTPATLDSVARDIRMLKEAEAERSSMVKQHVFIMYGIFFMFLGIAVMIIYVMVPMLTSQPDVGGMFGGAGGFENPCEGVLTFPCDFYSLVSVMLLGEAGTSLGSYYVSLFFSVILMQGIFTGLIAGQLGENSVIAGAKHSLIMLSAAFGIFLFLAKTGLLPV
jgi:flagellar protein FlaJ